MLTWIGAALILAAQPQSDGAKKTTVETSESDAPEAEVVDAAKTEEASKKESYGGPKKANAKPYVFGWVDYAEPSLKLRGGTTTGPAVELAKEKSAEWLAVRGEGLSELERDRAAILAMAGEYRVSFDFLEVEVYGEASTPSTPYRSWATEKVYVLEDSEEVISLQHIIVMFMVLPSGETQGPMLVKHWRQDWTYEPESALEFVGERQWKTRPLAETERKGVWQQAVYQVDDSPRYTMHGTWEHNANFSAWNTDSAWRPLPRREHTVRSDYHVTVGPNRITVHPTGWTHTQDNLKTVLSAPGEIHADNPAVARELGVNRYERISGFDFSAGDEYWEKTQSFWSEIRAGWAKHLSSAETVQVATHCEDKRIYESLFMLADKETKSKRAKRKRSTKVSELLGCVVSPVESAAK